MPVSLPAKTAPPTPENIRQLEDGLKSLIAYNPQTVDRACGFYDAIDRLLGPWGRDGYPLGYGKYYCVAFNMNQKLRTNHVTWRWVSKTTILLQTSLKDFIVERFKAGGLASLTEAELRSHAFDNHPKAYTAGGLTNVILYAPEMLPIIMTIPGAEFDRASANYEASVRQVAMTAGMQAPRVVVSVLAQPALGLAGPAHTGIMSRAVRQAVNSRLRADALNRELSSLHRQIKRGKLDNIGVLNHIIQQLEFRRYPNQGFHRFAGELIHAAKQRKQYVQKFYQSLPKGAPRIEVRP